MVSDHFWLFCGLWVGGLSFVIGKFKAKSLIESGEITYIEANTYLRNFSIFIITPSLAFWLLQQSIASSVSADFLSWPNPQKAIALTILVGLWIYLLIWTLFLGGEKPLSQTLRLVSSFPSFMLKPTPIKIFVIFSVLVGFLSLFMGHA
jgi:hypothetical protein